MGLEVPGEIHALGQGSDLGGIAVEGKGGAPSQVADAALGSLAPARMIDLGIDVGVEAVLVGGRAVPSRRRLLLGEADFYDRFDALAALLPRGGPTQAGGRARPAAGRPPPP